MARTGSSLSFGPLTLMRFLLNEGCPSNGLTIPQMLPAARGNSMVPDIMAPSNDDAEKDNARGGTFYVRPGGDQARGDFS